MADGGEVVGRHFLAIVRSVSPGGDYHMWERLECLACGWDMTKENKLLGDVERHVCDVVDIPHWLEVVRDAFLSGDDRRAITIIETMEPDKFRYAEQIGTLRNALHAAILHVEMHNSDYHTVGRPVGHVTPTEVIESWKKIGGL